MFERVDLERVRSLSLRVFSGALGCGIALALLLIITRLKEGVVFDVLILLASATVFTAMIAYAVGFIPNAVLFYRNVRRLVRWYRGDHRRM